MKLVWFALALLVGCGASQSQPRPGTEGSARTTHADAPSPEQIVQAMGAVVDDVSACGRGSHGEVSVRFEFESSGAVANASINGAYHFAASEPGPGCDPTPDDRDIYTCQRTRAPVPEVDRCILRVVRGVRIPPFARASFRVNYPFRY